MAGMGRVTERRGVLRIDLGDSATRSAGRTRWRPRSRWRSGSAGRASRGDRSPSPCVRPGDDIDLAIGFLLTEGMIARAPTTCSPPSCAPATDEPNTYNVVDVTLAPHVPRARHRPDPQLLHHQLVRGLRQGEHRRGPHPVALRRSPPTTTADRGRRRPWPRCRTGCAAAQRTFDRTGGLHAAGLFTAAGDLVVRARGRRPAQRRRQGGRLGAARAAGCRWPGTCCWSSGRASFELAQKASMAGHPVLAAVSAPSTLAVDLADEAGHDPRRLPARPDDERLRRRRPGRRLNGSTSGRRAPTAAARPHDPVQQLGESVVRAGRRAPGPGRGGPGGLPAPPGGEREQAARPPARRSRPPGHTIHARWPRARRVRHGDGRQRHVPTGVEVSSTASHARSSS